MVLLRAPRSLAAPTLCAGLLALGACHDSSRDAPRPNVILISIDTLRPDFLGCYGHPRPTSPTIDALAARGALFSDVTAAAPWTLPSHATMLTGLYPSHHGVVDHTFKLASETLAKRFSGAGYQTLAVVNSHNIGDPSYGLLEGFDPGKAEYVFEMDPPDGGPIVNRGNAVTSKAIAAMNERDASRPFFLFLHYYDVHTDFTPDPKWKLEFVRTEDSKLDGTTDQLTRLRARGVQLSETDLAWLCEMYEAEIRTLDEILERLFDHLEASGLAENTLIVLTSDHGEEFFEHKGLLHGRTHYQELVRIPLILAGPGVPRGRRIDAPVHGVDVAPTIWALAGVAAPNGLDGIDLSLAWRDPRALPRTRTLFAEADHNNKVADKEVVNVKRMVRAGQEKLLYDTRSKAKELYDLGQDPGEKQDLAAAEPERVAALWKELEDFMNGAREGNYAGPLDDARLKELGMLGYVELEQEPDAPGPSSAPLRATPSASPADSVAAMRAAAEELARRPELDVGRIEVQHLLVSFAGAPRVEATRTKEEAEALAAELFARAKGGEDFGALVQQSTDDSYPGIYPMTRRQRKAMAPAFGDTGWRLEVGEIGIALYDSMRSPFGWHLIKRTK